MKSTEVLNPWRNYIAVAVFTYYNTSPLFHCKQHHAKCKSCKSEKTFTSGIVRLLLLAVVRLTLEDGSEIWKAI